MIEILLLIAIIVAGYVSCIIHPELKHKIHLYSNRQLYFRVVEYGLYCFILSILLLSVVVLKYGNDFTFYYMECLLLDNCARFCDFTDGFLTGVVEYKCTISERNFAILTLIILTVSMLLVAYINKLFVTIIIFFKYSLHTVKLTRADKNSKQRTIKKLYHCLLKMYQLSDVFAVHNSLGNTPLYQLLYESTIHSNLYVILEVKEGMRYYGKVSTMGEINETGGIDHSLSLKVVSLDRTNLDNSTISLGLYEGRTVSIRTDSIVNVVSMQVLKNK